MLNKVRLASFDSRPVEMIVEKYFAGDTSVYKGKIHGYDHSVEPGLYYIMGTGSYYSYYNGENFSSLDMYGPDYQEWLEGGNNWKPQRFWMSDTNVNNMFVDGICRFANYGSD